MGQLYEEEQKSDYAEVWETDNPLDVIEWVNLHPLLGTTIDPNKVIHPLLDKETERVFIVGIALGSRITIGDIDPDTGTVIEGKYEDAPIIIFAECTASFLRHIINARRSSALPEFQNDAHQKRINLMRELAGNLKKK